MQAAAAAAAAAGHAHNKEDIRFTLNQAQSDMSNKIKFVPLPLFPTSSRGATELREVDFRTGLVPEATGSCWYSAGSGAYSTKVCCCVLGPKPVKQVSLAESSHAILTCYVKFTGVSGRESIIDEETALARSLQAALLPSLCLHRFPKSEIEVHCSVIEDCGSLLPCSITAASLALIDAGIDCKGLVVAATASVLADGAMQIDPDSSCVAEAHVTPSSPPPPTTAAQVACMPAHDVCTQVVAGGTMQLAVFEATRAAASSAARALHSLLRSRLLASIKSQS